jgi:hypothetical protein
VGALDITDIAYGWVACIDDCMVTTKIYPEFDTRFVRIFLLRSVVYSIHAFMYLC